MSLTAGTPGGGSGSSAAAQPKTAALRELAADLLEGCELFIFPSDDLDTEGFLRRLRVISSSLRVPAGSAGAGSWVKAAVPLYATVQRRALMEREDEMRRLLSAYGRATGAVRAARSKELAALAHTLFRLREAARAEDIREIRTRIETEIRDTEKFLDERQQADRARLAALEEEVEHLEKQLARQRDQLKHDPLTGLLHRAIVVERAAAMAASRLGFSVAILQVDNFPQIIQQLGPGRSDQVLHSAAAELKRLTRTHDALGRWCGDQFALALVGVNPEQMAARVGGAVARRRLQMEQQNGAVTLVHLSLSCGIAGWAPGIELGQLFAAAEAAAAAAAGAGGASIRLAPLDLPDQASGSEISPPG